MKIRFFFLTMIFPVFLLAQDINYNLKGKIAELNAPAKVYLGYKMGNADFLDSAAIIKGVFEFKGKAKNPVQAMLVLNYAGKPSWKSNAEIKMVYLEDGEVSISSPDSLKHAQIKGTKENLLAKTLEEALEVPNGKMYALSSELNLLPPDKKKDKEFMKEIMADYISRQKIILNEQNQVRADFIRSNPGSIVSLNQILAINKFLDDYNYLSTLFNVLTDQVKGTSDGKMFANKLARMKVTEAGSMAIDFTQPDVNGKEIKLSDYRGRYVFVDFWASWCSACRMENPNVVKAYNKYHSKGLEILGVSLDNEKTKAAWLAAIKHDGLTWTQVSDLKGWNNEAARRYGIMAIPQNVLLDKTGRIIAKNIRAEKLEAKLAEVFK